MKTTLLALFATALPGLALGESPTANADLAVQLVHTMRLEATVSAHSDAGARRAFADGRITRAQLDCVLIKPEDWTPDLARHVESIMSEEEIRTTLEFVRTEAGRRLVESTQQEAEARRRGDASYRRPPIDSEKDAALQAFLGTSAGKKFMESRGFTSNDDVNKIMGGKMGPLLKSCGAAAKPPG